MELLPVVDAIVYLGLAAHIGVRAARTGQLALRRLAWFVACIGVVAATIPLVGEEGDSWIAVVAMLGGLALYPALLLRLGAALAPETGPLQRLTVLALAVEAVALASIPLVMDPLPALLADMVAVAAVAAVAHVVVHVVLERQVRTLASSYVRRRARALQAGLGLLALSLVGGVLVDFALAEYATLLAALAAGLLSVATVPPRWLQAAFAQPDYDRLAAGEEAVATADDHHAAVGDLLAALQRMATARAVWLERDGHLVAAVGDDPASFTPVGATGDPERGGARRVVDTDGAVQWLLTASARSCELQVVTGRDPVLYGLHDAELLPRSVRRVAIALEGRTLEAQRRARERAEQEAEHFRRVAELKDDLLATINHELRTPLQTVSGALELVLHRWEQVDDEQRHLLVQRAEHNARALSEVVMDVLSLVELRTGVVRPAARATSLRGLVEGEVGEVDDQGRIEVACPLAEVVVDPLLVRRVLRQLVDNALEHTEGPVRVEVDVDETDLRVVVHDTGAGVPDQLLAPFERGGHYLHRTTRGLGLGLSLAVETVQLLDGELRFDNDGRGASATCRLPHRGVTHDADATSTSLVAD